MILDAPTLIAYFDGGAADHWSVAGDIELLAKIEPLIISPIVVSELEPLILAQFGRQGWLAVLDELAGGAWTIAVVDAAHLGEMRELLEEGGNCADASVAALAAS